MTGKLQKETKQAMLSSQLSLPLCTQRKSGKPTFRLWPRTQERRSSLLSPSHCFSETNLKEKTILSTQKDKSFASFFSRQKTRRAQKPNQTCLLSTCSMLLSPLPNTSSFVDFGEHTLRGTQPTPSPPQLEATLHHFSASARSTKACSTVRCKRQSWLAVSSTSPIFSAVRSCTRACETNFNNSTVSYG